MSARTASGGRERTKRLRERGGGGATAPQTVAREQDLARRRAAVDRVNCRLRDLLQRRARLTLEIAAWKRARGLTVVDPAREHDMLERLLADPGQGFDRGTLARLLRSIFGACRELAVRDPKNSPRPRARRPRRRRNKEL